MPVPPDHPPVVIRQLRWGLALLLAAGLGWACTLVAQDVVDLKEKPLREFYQDFRGGRSLNSSLKLIGPDIDAVTKQEDLGLRITLPKDRALNQPLEVMTLFSLAGDFEVTGSYELLYADQPAKGYGAGVALSLETNEARDKFAKVAREMRVKDGSVYVTEYWRKDPPKDYKTFSVKTETRAGQLRLVRVGAKLHFLVADGAGNDFRELKQQEFGTDDIADVRFVVEDSGSPGNAVDARLVDLKIRASKLAPDPVAAGRPAADGPVKSAARGWLMAALVIGAAIIVFVSGAAAAAIFLRRRPAVQAPAANQPAATEAAAPIVAVACAGCGKQLKAKAELAGRKIKCPQCGKAVAIPAAKASDAE